MKDFEIKANFTDSQYKAVMRVVEAMGMTTSGFVRHVILHYLVDHEDKVSRMIELTGRSDLGQK